MRGHLEIHTRYQQISSSRSNKAPDYDYLVFDPDDTTHFEDWLWVTIQDTPSRDEQQRILTVDTQIGNGPFQRLPPELRDLICGFLPSTSVGAVRKASRPMAALSLSKRFWLSRFDHPHEFSHVEPPSFRRTGELDWSTLYRNLNDADSKGGLGWRNRKRIASLCRLLIKRMTSEETTEQSNCLEDYVQAPN